MLLAKKGCAEHVFAAGFPPLKELIDLYIEAGGEIISLRPLYELTKTGSGY